MKPPTAVDTGSPVWAMAPAVAVAASRGSTAVRVKRMILSESSRERRTLRPLKKSALMACAGTSKRGTKRTPFSLSHARKRKERSRCKSVRRVSLLLRTMSSKAVSSRILRSKELSSSNTVTPFPCAASRAGMMSRSTMRWVQSRANARPLFSTSARQALAASAANSPRCSLSRLSTRAREAARTG